jgi:hypothetical protein
LSFKKALLKCREQENYPTISFYVPPRVGISFETQITPGTTKDMAKNH